MNCLWHLYLHSLVLGFLSRLTPDSIKTRVHDEEEHDDDDDEDNEDDEDDVGEYGDDGDDDNDNFEKLSRKFIQGHLGIVLLTMTML